MSFQFRCVEAFQLKDYRLHFTGTFQTVNQITRGPFYAKAEYLALASDIFITRRYTDQTLLETGVIPDGYVVFALLPQDNIFFETRKFPEAGNVGIRLGRYEFKVLSCKTSRHLTIRVPVSSLKKYCGDVGLRQFFYSLQHSHRHLVVDNEPFSSLYNYVNTIFDSIHATNRSGIDREHVAKQVGSNIYAKLGALIRVLRPFDTRTNSREKWFEKALNYILTTNIARANVENVCSEINVSRRNLEMAFSDCINISPAEFIANLRLNHAYRALLASSCGLNTVAQIAQAAGFNHMGNFSKKYQLHFSEFPSETLRKNSTDTMEYNVGASAKLLLSE